MDELERARRSERRIVARIVFWALNLPAVAACYFLARSTFLEASLLYLALVSVENNLETALAQLAGKRGERRTLEAEGDSAAP